MILFHSVTDEDDRDTDRRGSGLTSIRTFIFGILAVITLATLFLLLVMPGCTEAKGWYLTKANLKEIAAGFQAYSQSNDSGYPPAFEIENGEIAVSNHRPITWATQIAEYVPKGSLTHPQSRDEWDTHIAYPGAKDSVNLSYGANSAVLSPHIRTYEFQNANSLVLLAETIGGGHQNSYNPMPLQAPEGRDGFLIGFDDSNSGPTQRSRSVTRLAFFNAMSANPTPIHPSHGVAAISPEGSLIVLTPADQQLNSSKQRWLNKR